MMLRSCVSWYDQCSSPATIEFLGDLLRNVATDIDEFLQSFPHLPLLVMRNLSSQMERHLERKSLPIQDIEEMRGLAEFVEIFVGLEPAAVNTSNHGRPFVRELPAGANLTAIYVLAHHCISIVEGQTFTAMDDFRRDVGLVLVSLTAALHSRLSDDYDVTTMQHEILSRPSTLALFPHTLRTSRK
ncbi:hypothetical protein BDV98DRAFT_54401 [Pterulicium gracile]|uniref:Uncharacterized protein n=1 Tax=Pterulicium gracile TaxID=1884261 RepID=A0A5C3QJS8_9AGAR|nr:hypothetical protein BDV98DRAFT_54401 [Pterula gracilis]